jgi:hypothetical protein
VFEGCSQKFDCCKNAAESISAFIAKSNTTTGETGSAELPSDPSLAR